MDAQKKREEALREEEKPTLIGQLKLLRQTWDEGFDEDIAAPLAQIIRTGRKQLEAMQEAHEKELDSKDEEIETLESAGEENAAHAGEFKELREDLDDVPRGIRTLDEVLAKYQPVA